MDMSLNKLREIVEDREAWRCCSPWGRKESDMTERMKSSNRPEKPYPVSEMPLGLPAPTERAGSICASNIRVQSASLAAWRGLHPSIHSFSTKKDVLTTTTPRALSWSLAHTHLTDPAAQGVATIYYSLHGLDKKTEFQGVVSH